MIDLFKVFTDREREGESMLKQSIETVNSDVHAMQQSTIFIELFLRTITY